MKKLLFISAFTPGTASAGQHYTKNLLEDISSRYRIDLIYFKYKDQVYTPVSSNINVKAAVSLSPADRLINFLQCPRFHPFFSSRFNRGLLKRIRQIMAATSYDVICFDFTQVFLYATFLDHPDKVLIAHDVIFQKYCRDGYAIERPWILKNESRLLKQGRIQTFSDKDGLLVNKLYNRKTETVHFYLAPDIVKLKLDVAHTDNCFCFFAAWHRPENAEGLRWFLTHVLPATKNAFYRIIGPNLPDDISIRIRNYPNIAYVGFVENPYELISRSKALLAPLFKGAGVKVKAIESLTCGTPVIGTEIALEGISDPGLNAMIKCADASEFKNAILNFEFPDADKLRLRQSFMAAYNNFKKTVL